MTAARRGPARWLILLVAVAGAVAVLAVIAFWPRGDAPDLGPRPTRYVDATVRAVDRGTCADPDTATSGPCRVVTAQLTSGTRAGDQVTFRVLAAETDVPAVLHPGDEIVLHDAPAAPADARYSFADVERATALWWLVAGFVVVVLVFGRGKGVRALLGLAAAAAVLAVFLVPALVRDRPVVPVVLAAAVVIAFVALYLAHGVNMGTTVALAGTLMSLALTAGLAVAVAAATHLSGLADGSAQALPLAAAALDLRGLLVAGIVVGVLGALGDVTVSQVSIVAALRRANLGLRGRLLYREASIVGRDHLASTINTLVLAYAGAALPLLVLFAGGGQPVGRSLTSEAVAVVVVRMLVGAIGLVLSVPVTTALAAWVLGPASPADLAGHSRGRIGDDPVADGGGPDGPPPAHAATNGGRGRRARGRAASEDDLAPVEEE